MGFHTASSAFARRGSDLDEARRTLWLWAEPIIIDRAVESYVRLLDEVGTVAVARKHCRLWRSVLFDAPSAVPALLDDLRDTVEGLGLSGSFVDDSNDVILEELVDIVAGRHRTSRNAMKTYSLVLIAATASLGGARLSQ